MASGTAYSRFVKSRVGPIGAFLVALVVTTSLVGPLLAPHDPYVQNAERLVDDVGLPVGPGEVAGYYLGADPIGRDELARLLHGGRVSMSVGFAGTLLAASIGVVLGIAAGFLGGVTDAVLVFVIDAMLSIPFLLVAMCIRKVVPSAGIGTMALLLGSLSWPGIARIVRSRTLTLRELDYVTAAHAMGASRLHIAFRHLLPNLAGPIIAIGTGLVSGIVLSESSLSFLGLGIDPPAASWGSMLSESQGHLFDIPRLFVFPMVPLIASILGFHLLGQGLRDALDPKD